MKESEIQAKLMKDLEESRKRMADCTHDFADPIYDPDTEMVGYGLVQDGAGSDPHWSYAGYTKKDVPRWSRECKKCGHKEYTKEREPVSSETKPKFR